MRLLWTDIETSDLTPDDSELLEISMIITDTNLVRLAQYTAIVHHDYIPRMPGVVFEMHQKSGLLSDILDSTKSISMNRIEDGLVELFDGYEDKLIMAGNTVGFDLNFLRHPNIFGAVISENVSHQVLDVSSLELYRRIVENDHMGMEKYPKEKGHRSLKDVEESIAEYKYLTNRFNSAFYKS